jgi:hypothetical protein
MHGTENLKKKTDEYLLCSGKPPVINPVVLGSLLSLNLALEAYKNMNYSCTL